MVAPFSGRCACGQVRYVCSSAPIAMINCHCRDCQQSSGAPFASGVVVNASDVKVTGTVTTYAVRGSSGNSTVRSFCPQCGSPLFAQSAAANGFMSIRFPSLDDQSMFKPMLDIWTSSAQPWVCLDVSIPHFAESPQGPPPVRAT
jgi:hypothetical protein